MSGVRQVRVAIGAAAHWLASFVGFAAVFSLPSYADVVALVVPRSVIYAGDAIAGTILERRQFRSETVAMVDVYATIEQAHGKIARRTLLPGQPIPLTAIRANFTVMQGQAARLAYVIDGLQITAEGQAMQSGGIGDVIPVRNRQSGVVVRGRIESDHSISVGRE